MRLADKRLGLLVHFGAELIKDGISRVANRLIQDEQGLLFDDLYDEE